MKQQSEDDQDQFIYHIKHTITSDMKVSIDKVKVVWSDQESEYCIYIDGQWCGYYDLDKGE